MEGGVWGYVEDDGDEGLRGGWGGWCDGEVLDGTKSDDVWIQQRSFV